MCVSVCVFVCLCVCVCVGRLGMCACVHTCMAALLPVVTPSLQSSAMKKRLHGYRGYLGIWKETMWVDEEDDKPTEEEEEELNDTDNCGAIVPE